MVKKEVVSKELERIRNQNGGVLNPADVVAAAAPKSNPIHDLFTWDDTAAAIEYRLWQARMLIRVTVTVLPGDTKESRVYVSLEEDRNSEGGYRHVVDVLQDSDLREKLLEQALEELSEIQKKYKHLKELAVIFSSIKRVKSKRLMIAVK